jgi:transcriptional regulator with XRE-family HTH domain
MRALTLTFQPDRFRALRDALGLSRAELATRLGVTRQLIWMYETGRHTPSAPVLLRLGQLTGARLESFYVARRPKPETPTPATS